MMFKKGDKVRVISNAGINEIGVVRKVYKESCMVDFKIFFQPYRFDELELVADEPQEEE